MKIVVVITLMDDERVLDTLYSLSTQSLKPDRVFVADASRDTELSDEVKSWGKEYGLNVEVHRIPGSVAESRNKTMSFLDEDIVVFIDSDEVARKNWLYEITRPLFFEDADYTAGLCEPRYYLGTKVEKYVWMKERQLFEDYDQLSFQMGNTAWRRHVFDRIGNFDKRIIWGGEDYDINIRATQAGFKGLYIPSAILYHDQGMKTLSSWVRKRYKYHTGSTVALLKNSVSVSSKKRTISMGRHPLDMLDFVLKILGYIRGHRIWVNMLGEYL